MKKNNALKPVIFAILGLLAGILIGMSINGFPPHDNELVGSIGKVDNKRNVRITEEDVQLRNDLAEDTVKLLQYQRYLSYIYYKSLKSSTDIERVISLTEDNQEFINSLNQTKTLDGYLTYLSSARADLLNALHAVSNPDMDKKVPIIKYLNEAQDAASRIQSNEVILLSYIDGIEAWLASHPGQNDQNLKEAHDLLALSVLENALIAQDKPMLKYLKDKELCSDNQSLETVFNDTSQRAEMLAFMALDNSGAENFNVQSSQKIVKSMEQLNLVFDLFKSSLGQIYTDQQKLGAVNDQQKLGAVNDQQKLGVFMDQQKLGLFMDQQKLGAVNDQQQLGLINSQQLLGGVIFNLDQQSLGAIVFDMQMIQSEALGCCCCPDPPLSDWFN